MASSSAMRLGQLPGDSEDSIAGEFSNSVQPGSAAIHRRGRKPVSELLRQRGPSVAVILIGAPTGAGGLSSRADRKAAKTRFQRYAALLDLPGRAAWALLMAGQMRRLWAWLCWRLGVSWMGMLDHPTPTTSCWLRAKAWATASHLASSSTQRWLLQSWRAIRLLSLGTRVPPRTRLSRWPHQSSSPRCAPGDSRSPADHQIQGKTRLRPMHTVRCWVRGKTSMDRRRAALSPGHPGHPWPSRLPAGFGLEMSRLFSRGETHPCSHRFVQGDT